MARTFHPIVAFAGVLAVSTAVIVGALSYTASELSVAVAQLPPVKANVRQGYVSSLPEVKQSDFNIARAVPVSVDMTAKAAVFTELPSAPEPAAPTFTHRVAVNGLNVRSQPSKHGQKLFAIRGGSEVSALSSKGGWTRVRLDDGRSGWVWGQMLASLN
ncbi:SH3 domain-containing protein [Devosia sp.]|uniref:SH3 domain-containing protein n=1 Tax=Devosia sp. TaxID=1871048 RepID=UPI003A8D165C